MTFLQYLVQTQVPKTMQPQNSGQQSWDVTLNKDILLQHCPGQQLILLLCPYAYLPLLMTIIRLVSNTEGTLAHQAKFPPIFLQPPPPLAPKAYMQ